MTTEVASLFSWTQGISIRKAAKKIIILYFYFLKTIFRRILDMFLDMYDE